MQSSGTLNEPQVDSVLEDFEEGDKVYFRRTSSSNSISGVVEEVEEACIWVKPFYHGPNPDLIQVGSISKGDDDIFYVGQWSKIPDDTLIKVGDTMSTKSLPWVKESGARELFTVIEIIPGRRIALRSHETPSYVAKIEGYLDSYLKDWEMEG